MQKLIISKDNCFVIPKYNQAHDFSNVSKLNRHINKLWSVWLVLKKIIKASERTLKNHQKRLAAGRAVEFWGYMLYFKSQQVGAASCPVQDCSEEHGRLKFTHGALCLYLLLNSSLCVQYSSNYFERYNLAWTYSTVKNPSETGTVHWINGLRIIQLKVKNEIVLSRKSTASMFQQMPKHAISEIMIYRSNSFMKDTAKSLYYIVQLYCIFFFDL